MAKIGQAGDSATTSVFRIAGMAAGDNHFQLSAGRLLVRPNLTNCFHYRGAKDKRRSQTPGAH